MLKAQRSTASTPASTQAHTQEPGSAAADRPLPRNYHGQDRRIGAGQHSLMPAAAKDSSPRSCYGNCPGSSSPDSISMPGGCRPRRSKIPARRCRGKHFRNPVPRYELRCRWLLRSAREIKPIPIRALKELARTAKACTWSSACRTTGFLANQACREEPRYSTSRQRSGPQTVLDQESVRRVRGAGVGRRMARRVTALDHLCWDAALGQGGKAARKVSTWWRRPPPPPPSFAMPPRRPPSGGGGADAATRHGGRARGGRPWPLPSSRVLIARNPISHRAGSAPTAVPRSRTFNQPRKWLSPQTFFNIPPFLLQAQNRRRRHLEVHGGTGMSSMDRVHHYQYSDPHAPFVEHRYGNLECWSSSCGHSRILADAS